VPADAHRREFAFSGHHTINDREMDLARIDEVVPAGALELWHVSSLSEPHVFHVHGATFHILEVEGEEPEPWRRGPKDSVVVVPGRSVTLAVRFREHVDPDHPYMFHCHILRHEDSGMMGQFVVVEPGTEAGIDRTLDGAETGSHDH
jgi:FtsP/CotA-like multicopper oxidase with cupredoxin domain